MLSVFQQFVGINAVLYYAPLMFKNMGASTDSALWQTVIVGVANVIFTRGRHPDGRPAGPQAAADHRWLS